MLSEEQAGRLVRAKVEEGPVQHFGCTRYDAALLCRLLNECTTNATAWKSMNGWALVLVRRGLRGDELCEELADLIVTNFRRAW